MGGFRERMNESEIGDHKTEWAGDEAFVRDGGSAKQKCRRELSAVRFLHSFPVLTTSKPALK
jgi:hypothetical protein